MNRREFLRGAVAAGAGVGLLRPPGRAAPASTAPAPLDPARIFPDVALHNIDHLEASPSGEGFRLNRVPSALWPKLNRPAQARACNAAGAEIRFNLAGRDARIRARFVEDRSNKARGWPVLVEIRQGDFLLRCVELREAWTDLVIPRAPHPDRLAAASPRQRRGFDPALVRLALPYMPVTELLRIDGDVTPPRPAQLPGCRYLAYGSSITHGAYAQRAAETYPARVAHALGVDHFNLGFSAGAHLEPEVAAWIARRDDWDFATFELGVNLLTPLSTADFRTRVEQFLALIAAAPRDRWVFVIDVITSGPEFEANPKRREFRAVVAEAVRALGRPKIRHIEGLSLLTRTTGLALDLLHPSAEGFGEIAERLAPQIRAAMRDELPSF